MANSKTNSNVNRDNVNDKGTIANSFKGFEAFVAQIKMFWHMMFTIFLVITLIQVAIIITLYKITNGGIFTFNMNAQQRCVAKMYKKLEINDYINFDIFGAGKGEDKTFLEYKCEGGTPIKISKKEFREKFTDYSKKHLMPKYKFCVIIVYLFTGIPLYCYGFIYFIRKLNRRHKEETEDKFLRGKVITTEEDFETNKDDRMKKGRQIAITDKVSIPESIVTRHNFVIGKPGSGKSQLITRIIDQLMSMNVKMIIHDFKGDFVPMYYDEDRDYIFCPIDRRHVGLNFGDIKEIGKDANGNRLYNKDDRKPYPKVMFEKWPEDFTDEKGVFHKKGSPRLDENGKQIKIPTGWTVFNDIKDLMDVDAFAAAVIPDANSGEQYWAIAPRDIFKAILIYCIKKDAQLRAEGTDLDDEKNAHLRTKTNKKIREMLLMGMEKLNELFKEFPVECGVGSQHLQEAKVGTQLLSLLSANTSFFIYLDNTDGDFSISKWIQDNNSTKRVIYVTNQAKVQEALKPLITTFVDFATKALCSMLDDMDRRLYFILDEFGQLAKIGSIVQLLTQARSKGGAAFLLIQDQAQIQNIYGDNLVKSIVNSCGNKFYFAVGDQTTADQISQELGTIEVLRNKESKSFGVGDFKDTISQNADITETRIALASEILTLPTLTCWAQITDLPLVHVKFSYTPPRINTAPVILRDFAFDASSPKADKELADKADAEELENQNNMEVPFADGSQANMTVEAILNLENPAFKISISTDVDDPDGESADADEIADAEMDRKPELIMKQERIQDVVEKIPVGVKWV